MMILCASPFDSLTSRNPSAPAPPDLLMTTIGGSIYFIHLPHFARRLSPQAPYATLTEVKAARRTQLLPASAGSRLPSHFPTATTTTAPTSPATDSSNLRPKSEKTSKSTIQWALTLNHSTTTGSVTSISPDT